MSKIIKNVIAAVFWLLLWQIAALIVNNSILLSGPAETIGCLVKLCGEADFWNSVLRSYINIMTGILLGTFLGVLLGVLAYVYGIVDIFLSPLVSTVKAIPVASFIILILIWLGSENVSVFIACLVVFPIVFTGIKNGLGTADKKLLEMAYVYRMPRLNKLKFIYFPSLIPFVISAMSLAIPMGFKSGVAAEVIGQPLLSMGNGMYRAKIYLDTGDLFAWTLVVVFVSFVTEKIILFILSLFDKKGGGKDDNRS